MTIKHLLTVKSYIPKILVTFLLMEKLRKKYSQMCWFIRNILSIFPTRIKSPRDRNN